MLIRLISSETVEYPDDLGALVLADAIQVDDQAFSLEEINFIVNGVLVLIYDEALSIEENITQARLHCAEWGTPDASAMKKGMEQIKRYNENVPLEQIGYSSQELIDKFYGLKASKKKACLYNRPKHGRS